MHGFLELLLCIITSTVDETNACASCDRPVLWLPTLPGLLNWLECSPSRSSSSLDEKASAALKAMFREHDEDSVIIESFLPMIRSRYNISAEYDLHIREVGQQPFDLFPIGFGLSIDAFEVGLRLLKTKMLVSKPPTNTTPVVLAMATLTRRLLSQLSLTRRPLRVGRGGAGVGTRRRLGPSPQGTFTGCRRMEPMPSCYAGGSSALCLQRRAWSSIAQYKETPDFKLGVEKMGQVSSKYEYQVALAHFRVRFPKLEVEEDPYATLPEDDNMPMEVGVPFDERDPPST
ncbi:hypothetical protein BHE74_00006701 [Ensete ventricosum]|nr:hypothetical protein BHE74_00006701 [Ensete ventricosum]